MVSFEDEPLPLAGWHVGVFGDRYELRPLPTEVASVPDHDMRVAIRRCLDDARSDPLLHAEAGMLYLNQSAMHINTGRHEDAFIAAREAGAQFESVRSYVPAAYQIFAARHAAAYYNAAVVHWRAGRHYLEVSDVLRAARETLGLVLDEDSRTVSYIATAGAISRLRTGPDRANWASRAMTQQGVPLDASLTRAAAGGDAHAASAVAVRARELGLLDVAIAWFAFAADLGDVAAKAEVDVLTDRWLAARRGWWEGEPGLWA